MATSTEAALSAAQRKRRVWTTVAIGVAAAGCVAVIVAAARGLLHLVFFGLAVVGLSLLAIGLHRRAASLPPRTYRGRRASLAAEMASWSIALPVSVLALVMAASVRIPPTQTVAGKPVEMSGSRKYVVMPDGRRFDYRCYNATRRHRGSCRNDANWSRIPSWPEPELVAMIVVGNRIRGLWMDGVMVVDPAELQDEANEKRGFALLTGLGVGALAGWQIDRRRRKRAAIPVRPRAKLRP